MTYFQLQEPYPWIRIELPKDFYIYKVQLYGSHLSGNNTSLEVHAVSDNVNDSIVKCNRNRKRTGMVFDCVPPVIGGVVQVLSQQHEEGNSTLSICDVFISGIGENICSYFTVKIKKKIRI